MNKTLPLYPQARGTSFKYDSGDWGVAKRIEYHPEEKKEIEVIPVTCDIVYERVRELHTAHPILPLESITLIKTTLKASQARNYEMESMAANAAIRAYCRVNTIPIQDAVRRIDILV